MIETSPCSLRQAFQPEDVQVERKQNEETLELNTNRVKDLVDKDNLDMLLTAAVEMEQNKITCSTPDCPVGEPHGEGLYLFKGEVLFSSAANKYFAPSLPPPEVVAAFNRYAATADDRRLYRQENYRIIQAFHTSHTVPCYPSENLDLVGYQPCVGKGCGIPNSIHHKQGAYFHNDRDPSLSFLRAAGNYFGYSNPPPEIWTAAFRMLQRKATKEDLELVSSFYDHHAHFGLAKKPRKQRK
ncbi:MAG: hypothetical protein Q9190_005675 [Brigantiaea leucoxantha]